MRLISVTLLLVSLALAACQGGQRMSKAASVDQPGVGQPDVVTDAAIPAPADSRCMLKCRAKADEKLAKCMKAGGASDACNAAQVDALLHCNTECPSP
jgi:hypothetical protein